MASALKKTIHAHGCRRCRTWYEDNCKTPKQNHLCAACKGLRPWQLLVDNRKPRPCCAATSRLATKDELARYSLRGEASWFICQTCKRTQVYRPTKADVFTKETT